MTAEHFIGAAIALMLVLALGWIDGQQREYWWQDWRPHWDDWR